MTAVVVHTRRDLLAVMGSGPRAVVMTMGALHDGHGELVRVARAAVGSSGTVLLTDFVNPTQFGHGEDFERYPRTLDGDIELASHAGADVVFAPDADEVYGSAGGFRRDSVTIDPGPDGDILEGAARPGHFRGVLTVVAKLIGMSGADLVFFGEKDYQQLVLVRRMVADLNLPVQVVGVPTVREPDGLAMSSRNRYLSEPERRVAAAIPRALAAAAGAASTGPDSAVTAALSVLDDSEGLDLDYLVVVDHELRPPPIAGPGRVLVACQVGTTRLIDNIAVELG